MIKISFLEISQRIKTLKIPEIDLVIGIGSGGIVPACLIAHQFDKPVQIISINFRNPDNTIKFTEPALLKSFEVLSDKKLKILLVDDVSVTGSTLNYARKILNEFEMVTLIMKGKNADFILFPEMKECVIWPWSNN